MTVPSENNRIEYLASGVGPYTFNFPIFDNSDLVITSVDAEDETSVSEYDEITHYTVSVAVYPGPGEITFVSGQEPPTGDTLIILRILPITQESDYVENDKFPAETLEDDLDRIVMILQQLEDNITTEVVDLADKFSGTSQTSVLIGVSPQTFETQANKLFKKGAFVIISSDAIPGNYMHGQVSAYSGTTLDVDVTNIGGSGTHDDWLIKVSGTRGTAGTDGLGTGTAGGLAEGSFANLHLMSAPSFEDSTHKVYLQHADQIVMDSGARVNTWDDLYADLDVSGVGGLDTGSRESERWYEIYAIRKSSDDTRNLLLHAWRKRHTDFTQQTIPNHSDRQFIGLVTSAEKVARRWTTTNAGELRYIEAEIWTSAGIPNQFWFTLHADNAGEPGTLLATGHKISGNGFGSVSRVQRWGFPTAPVLAASTTYWIVAQGDWTIDGFLSYQWVKTDEVFVPPTTFAVKLFNGTVWGAGQTFGLSLTSYVTTQPTSVSMPAGYDQKAHIGYVREVGGTTIRSFRALNRKIHYGRGNGMYMVANVPIEQSVLDLTLWIPPARPCFVGMHVIAEGSASIFNANYFVELGPIHKKATPTITDNLQDFREVVYQGVHTPMMLADFDALTMTASQPSALDLWMTGIEW